MICNSFSKIQELLGSIEKEVFVTTKNITVDITVKREDENKYVHTESYSFNAKPIDVTELDSLLDVVEKQLESTKRITNLADKIKKINELK